MAGPVQLAEAPGELLDATLAGALGPDAVAALAVPPLEGDAAELARAVLGAAPDQLRLLRTKYKPGRSLTAYYAVGRDAGEARHAAITWRPQPGAGRVTPSAVSADGRTVLVAAPDDSMLTGLAVLSDPAALAARLGAVSPDLAAPAEALSIHTVRYRPGQRHVLRVDVGAGPARRVFLKLDRDDHGAQAVRVASVLRDRLGHHRHHMTIVEPAGYLVGERAAVWWEAAGPTLRELLASGAAPAPLLWRVGAALRAFHDAAGSLDRDEGPAHDASGEVRATLRAGEIVGGLCPSLGVRYRAVAEEVLARLPEAPGTAVTFTHGDVKGDNLVIARGRVAFLDLDRMARADRALDLGKLLADLRWLTPSASSHDDRRIDALAAGYGAADPTCWQRARLLAVLFQLKLAARRTAIHEGAWEQRMETAVAAAEQALAQEVTR